MDVSRHPFSGLRKVRGEFVLTGVKSVLRDLRDRRLVHLAGRHGASSPHPGKVSLQPLAAAAAASAPSADRCLLAHLSSFVQHSPRS